MQKLLVIVGPTASGKTALAVSLARELGGEVISADSRQVYRGLDIGTGKASKAEMKGVRHHLLDVAHPKKTFSADDFLVRARAAIDDIAARGKLPIIAGGTGFYIDVLTGRITIADIEPDPKLRARLSKKTARELYAMLERTDPARAMQLSSLSERSNKARLVRALEVAAGRKSGRKRGGPQGRRIDRTPDARYDALWIGIDPPLQALEEKISRRLKARIRIGMIAEARRLHAAGLSYKRMEELGLEYRALASLLQKKISREEFEYELYTDIRRYAKRQITYWKRNGEIHWFKPEEIPAIQRTVRTWL